MALKFCIISAAISVKLLPHIAFLQKYKQFRTTYGFDGRELPIPEKVQDRVREVMDDLKLSENEKSKFELFSVHDISMFHAGTVHLGYKAIIGIPPNFGFESADNLTMDDIQIRNKYIPWTEETSKQFLQSVVFSENAQKFAIAREILKAQRTDTILKPFNIGLDLFLALSVYDLFYSILKLAKKPKFIRYTAGLVSSLVGACIWISLENFINSDTDREITEKLVSLGPEYIQGGKEFYEKLCLRDNVLAQVVNITNLISSNGDRILRDGLPNSEQKLLFTLKLEELEKNNFLMNYNE